MAPEKRAGSEADDGPADKKARKESPPVLDLGGADGEALASCLQALVDQHPELASSIVSTANQYKGFNQLEKIRAQVESIEMGGECFFETLLGDMATIPKLVKKTHDLKFKHWALKYLVQCINATYADLSRGEDWEREDLDSAINCLKKFSKLLTEAERRDKVDKEILDLIDGAQCSNDKKMIAIKALYGPEGRKIETWGRQ